MKRVAPEEPSLVSVPSNPTPEGARVGVFETRDRVRLRYALFPRTGPVHKGTVCLVLRKRLGEANARRMEIEAEIEEGVAAQLSRLTALDDTWTFQGSTWIPLNIADSPPGRSSAGMSTLGGQIVLFGGDNGDGLLLSDAWAFNGTSWATTAIEPPALEGVSMATLGNEVVLFGAGDDGEPTAQEWGEALGTISYEIVTGIGARVPRSHRG